MRTKQYFKEDGTPLGENESGPCVKVSVFYGKGGMNFFNGKQEPRGYWLSVTRIKRNKTEFGSVEQSFMFQGGLKKFLLEVTRQSPKKAEEANRLAEGFIPEMLKHVVATCPLPTD